MELWVGRVVDNNGAECPHILSVAPPDRQTQPCPFEESRLGDRRAFLNSKCHRTCAAISLMLGILIFACTFINQASAFLERIDERVRIPALTGTFAAVGENEGEQNLQTEGALGYHCEGCGAQTCYGTSCQIAPNHYQFSSCYVCRRRPHPQPIWAGTVPCPECGGAATVRRHTPNWARLAQVELPFDFKVCPSVLAEGPKGSRGRVHAVSERGISHGQMASSCHAYY